MGSDAVWQQESRGWYGRAAGAVAEAGSNDGDDPFLNALGYEAADPSLQLYLQGAADFGGELP